MNADKNNPANTSDPTDAPIESLESTEIEAVELEAISRGLVLAASGGCLEK